MLHLFSRNLFIILALSGAVVQLFAQDAIITVNTSQDKKAVSPYIYGRNNTFDKPAQFYKDAGLRMARMNGGNNATKYNWRKKISSHPDWYNNVYGNDWDKTSKAISETYPGMQIMMAFQLLGRVAASSEYNFNDWQYNSSQWWEGVHQNLAGGGLPNESEPGGKALVEGDVLLYTEEWPADSTVEILNHWFGEGGIGLNKDQFLYWNMDNEPDVWNGTHDDVMSNGLLPAAEFMDNYISVAKKARALFPEIKICGPVTTSEWQWFKWGAENIRIDGKYYCWLEYFIKRCADEEKTSGIRVLDVVDLHNYPYAPTDLDALQNHRMYFDKTYVYPGANGIKTINGGWDVSLNKEYIFQRINDWLDKYYGENHGIKLGLSEWSPGPSDPDLASVIYASHLGTFANFGIEYFTPWSWFDGMWETMHLFSRYAKSYSVSSSSNLEKTISAYTTVTESADSTTIIIVNRDMKAFRTVRVDLNGISVTDGSYKSLQMSNLDGETFVSHTKNALKENSISVSANSFTMDVPPLSTTAVLLNSTPSTGTMNIVKQREIVKIFPIPADDILFVSLNSDLAESTQFRIFNYEGKDVMNFKAYYDGFSAIRMDVSSLPEGYYFLSVKNSQCASVGSFIITSRNVN